MSTVGQIEKRTQARVVKLFREQLGYDYLRDWTDRREELAHYSIALPPLPEQTAIAVVLSAIDAELAALEQRLATTRALKQGMMQELLTGRTRLI